MGLEAESELINGSERIHVRALLESHALILRGAMKKTLPTGEIANPRVTGDHLLFEHDGTSYTLLLPQGQAVKWVKKLTTAPPSLADKLGVDATRKALVWGQTEDAAVNEALAGATADRPEEASLGIAIVTVAEDLVTAIDSLTDAMPHAAMWVIHPKGARSALPESQVRDHLRALGFIDTKSCAVSDALTAIRFSRRKT
ncbi:MAG: hypothetical protein ACXWKW_11725 [Asticcacaulis sp.]